MTRSPWMQTVGSPSGASSERELAEVRAALAHHHGHQVDRDPVEQTELEALAGDGAGRHGDGAVPGDLLSLRDRGLIPSVTKWNGASG